MLKTEVVTGFDEQVLQDIIQIQLDSFPAGWAEGGDEGDGHFEAMLKAKENVHIFLKDGQKNIGYLLAIPHNIAVEELKDCDPLMRKNPGAYYIETISILPDHRGQGGWKLLLQTLAGELLKKGVMEITLHARVSNGFSQKVQKEFVAQKIRTIEKWKYYNYEEPTEYLEVEL